ncbi:S-layer homology domain-containing protein [Paenibacillus allorhizosphaerae]|uniref:SLH domain-containing protein n=1 Tax=Paenibacillus allorhizosphaerae TaxID=2849866 RepID=A0ABM8VI04_9BACL|nr:S-layer homology domain-containing protein [Paenibacillus allorhizosphaerae]CAG7643374.1 hypothetical protein PAECIP111802_03004 [Paenibacillus allorhizosphaerae]
MRKQAIKAILAAAIGSAALLPSHIQTASADAASFTDLSQAGAFQAAMTEMLNQNIFSGYGDAMIRPNQPITHAELAKVLVKTFHLIENGTKDAAFGDVANNDWYAGEVEALIDNGVISGKEAMFQPNKPVTQAYLTDALSKLLVKKSAIIQTWFKDGYQAEKPVSRGQAASLMQIAQPRKPSADAAVTGVKAVNPITLEVTFSAPLTAQDVDLEMAKKNFVFTDGMSIVNVPQLKNGAVSTYIVPVTLHKPGTTYTLTYKGKAAGTFAAMTNKISLNGTAQVTSDTFEVTSSQQDGVADYGYLVESYFGSRGGKEIAIDGNQSYNGVTYQVISSLRSRQALLTPENGQPIVVDYVPYTQATDGRQAPKFRLPSGEKLKPGVKYTVTSDWFTLKEDTFTAKEIAPLAIQSVKAVNETTLTITLAADPKDELFSGRSVKLTDESGQSLTAQYKVQTRKGAEGTFELTAGSKLNPSASYRVTPVGDWAVADNVVLQGK